MGLVWPAGGGLTDMSYPVSGVPPSSGAVQDRVTCLSPTWAAGVAGADGTDAVGVTELLVAAGPVPALLVAATSIVTGVPLVRPVMVALKVFGPTITGASLPALMLYSVMG
jgi:hypothetical protein